jgi:hypothetical protein
MHRYNSRKKNYSKKRRNTQKKRHMRKSKKQRGGATYGTGYGANCYDPNFSIYNTNMLKLFPYSPTKVQ